MASEHRLPAEFGFSGASPRGSDEHAGTQAGASMAGDREAGLGLVRWGQSAAGAVKARKHLLCKRVKQTVACQVFSHVETPSSMVKGVPRSVGVAQCAFSPRCPAPAASDIPEAPWAGRMRLSIVGAASVGFLGLAGTCSPAEASWHVGWQPPMPPFHHPYPSFPPAPMPRTRSSLCQPE